MLKFNNILTDNEKTESTSTESTKSNCIPYNHKKLQKHNSNIPQNKTNENQLPTHSLAYKRQHFHQQKCELSHCGSQQFFQLQQQHNSRLNLCAKKSTASITSEGHTKTLQNTLTALGSKNDLTLYGSGGTPSCHHYYVPIKE